MRKRRRRRRVRHLMSSMVRRARPCLLGARRARERGRVVSLGGRREEC